MSWNSHCAGYYSTPLHSYTTVNHNFILEQGLCFLTRFRKNMTQCESGHLLTLPSAPAHKEQVINAAVWLDNDDAWHSGDTINEYSLIDDETSSTNMDFSPLSPNSFEQKQNVLQPQQKAKTTESFLFHLNNIYISVSISNWYI